MIVLQILIIPIVILLLLSTVFIIGCIGTELPRYIAQDDQHFIKADDPEAAQTTNTTLPNVPILRI